MSILAVLQQYPNFVEKINEVVNSEKDYEEKDIEIEDGIEVKISFDKDFDESLDVTVFYAQDIRLNVEQTDEGNQESFYIEVTQKELDRMEKIYKSNEAQGRDTKISDLLRYKGREFEGSMESIRDLPVEFYDIIDSTQYSDTIEFRVKKEAVPQDVKLLAA